MARPITYGRSYPGPAFLSYGFRPLFFAAALFSGVALPLWALLLAGGAAPGFVSLPWHAHEMVFGYLGAVIGGFLLTAIPNWTGRLPVSGARLAALVALWLAGRIAMALGGADILSPATEAAIDLLYPVALAAAAVREIAAGNSRHNWPVVGLIGIFAGADALHHLAGWTGLDPLLGARLALATAGTLITVIGGRIVPSFTHNWLAKRPGGAFPLPFGAIDVAAIALTALGLFGWAVFPTLTPCGIALALAALAQAVRLARWQGWRTISEPLLAVLHLGYAWLVAALALMAAAILLPGQVDPAAAMHALAAGAIGVMTVAVMTRATLGHTGRALTADGGTIAIYALINLGAALRVAAGWLPGEPGAATATAGAIWSLGFLLFAAKYGRYLFQPRL